MVTTTYPFLSLCISAFLITSSESNDLAATVTKPSMKFRHFSHSSEQLDWYSSRLFKMGVRLVGSTDKDASFPVMVEIEDEYYPLCEDNFNDLTAQTLCEMYHYERGYRTTYTLADDQEFSYTNLECYQSQWTEATFDEDSYLHKQRNAVQKCKFRDYTDKNSTGVLPCAKNQAAAVHCFDLQRAVTWFPLVYYSRISNKEWSITFTLEIFKFGKKIPFFGRRGLEDFLNLSPDEFFTVSCGNHSTPTVKYSKKGQEYFELRGKFSPSCGECEDLYIIDGMQHLQHFWRICPRDD